MFGCFHFHFDIQTREYSTCLFLNAIWSVLCDDTDCKRLYKIGTTAVHWLKISSFKIWTIIILFLSITSWICVRSFYWFKIAYLLRNVCAWLWIYCVNKTNSSMRVYSECVHFWKVCICVTRIEHLSNEQFWVIVKLFLRCNKSINILYIYYIVENERIFQEWTEILQHIYWIYCHI